MFLQQLKVPIALCIRKDNSTFALVKFEKDILYIWVGGSCDYGHKERAGGGAYIAQVFSERSLPKSRDSNLQKKLKSETIHTYTCAEFGTTEFKMIFAAMNHALEKFLHIPDGPSKIIFLSNVQYILNFEKNLSQSLLKKVSIKILPYHKFQQLQEVHKMATNVMREFRDSAHYK